MKCSEIQPDRIMYVPTYNYIMCESIRKYKIKKYLIENGVSKENAVKIVNVKFGL